MKDILLCGYGAIGKKLFETEFYELAVKNGCPIYVYDPNCNEIFYSDERPRARFVSNVDSVPDSFSVVFVCVPTESIDGKCDTSIVEETVERFSSKAEVVVIKSTVPVGFTKKLSEIYTNVIFSPEFKATTQHGTKSEFLILGGDKALCKKVGALYRKVKDAYFTIKYTDSTSAEMCKYMVNCFLAMKVVFCNEIADACNQIGTDYEEVRDLFLLDERMSPSHTIVYPEKRYYDSHCFNKDVIAFANQFNLPLIAEVDKINNERKKLFK